MSDKIFKELKEEASLDAVNLNKRKVAAGEIVKSVLGILPLLSFNDTENKIISDSLTILERIHTHGK